ncbi:hypothetical protein BP5796_11467 [Coleophoma crateriformis]|uniref:RBR-type E3 ubiquitin transferase n=1 Tax=Coleophoma crateriformis TaxID=565419 RepID=A0A3D8QIF7_9HELO|nr:hypothetical protein BP5796_11467 [Coleophoma crateriformis]
MASSHGEHGEKVRRRRRVHSGSADKYKSRGGEEIIVETAVEEARRIRVHRLDSHRTHSRSVASSKMTSESHTTLTTSKSSSSHRRRRKGHHSEGAKRRTHKDSSSRHDDYVYKVPVAKPAERIVERKSSRDDGSTESEEELVSEEETVKPEPKKRRIRIVYLTPEEARRQERNHRSSMRSRDSERSKDDHDLTHRNKGRGSHKTNVLPASSPKRSQSTREASVSTSQPALKRNNTTASHSTSHRTHHTPSIATANPAAKRSSFLGSFFGPSIPHHHSEPASPPRLVECLTCLSDDIPVYKSAKLKCGHRMCHSCLKRIFKLSVIDPQHMPPKCCTSDHIPLKHVDRLFDIKFKKKWNLKFQEYSTKNRIYCPARRCGEWIKPGSIHSEGGRKYGKCSRCKTKVCCLCNGKWHGSRGCLKDEETARLLETAKQAGWQRCYNCRTMVELKEGCNHMTCRCTAEFCMICGLKWKSCNCPWFNYDAVEIDRLNHMRIPGEDVNEHPVPMDRPNRLRRPTAMNYDQEINQRRRQERMDEILARRLQRVAIDDDDDYNGGIGDINGIGNGAGHFMNEDYVRRAHTAVAGALGQANAAANYIMGVNRQRGIPPPVVRARGLGERYPTEQRGPPPPPMLRRLSVSEQPLPVRPAARLVPQRTGHDYAVEAAVHATRSVQRAPPPPVQSQVPKDSVLAGLGGSGRGSNRVGAWRSHVQPGVVPAEGVLSVVE